MAVIRRAALKRRRRMLKHIYKSLSCIILSIGGAMRYQLSLGRAVRFASLDVSRLALRRLPVRVSESCFAENPLIYRVSISTPPLYAGRRPGGRHRAGLNFFGIRSQSRAINTRGLSGHFPLQTNLTGVTINVIPGAITVQAVPLYVSAIQFNAIMRRTRPSAQLRFRWSSIMPAATSRRSGSQTMPWGFSPRSNAIRPWGNRKFHNASNQPYNTRQSTLSSAKRSFLHNRPGTVTGGDDVAPPSATCLPRWRCLSADFRPSRLQRTQSLLRRHRPSCVYRPGQCPNRLLGTGVRSNIRNGNQQLREHGDHNFRRRLLHLQIVLLR